MQGTKPGHPDNAVLEGPLSDTLVNSLSRAQPACHLLDAVLPSHISQTRERA